MSYKVMFVLNAIVVLAFGLAFLAVPVTVLKFFGTETTVPVLAMARFFGSAMITLGLVLWFAKDASDAKVQSGLGYSLLAGSVIGLIVTIYSSASSKAVIRSNSWIPLLVYVLFGLGYAFMIFLKPRMSEG